jgi:hypothetical protein
MNQKNKSQGIKMFQDVNAVIDFLKCEEPRNPLTKRKIKKGGKTYLQLEKQIKEEFPELFIEQHESQPLEKPKEIVRKLYAICPDQKNVGVPKRYRKMIMQSPLLRVKEDIFYFPTQEPLQKYFFKPLKKIIDKHKYNQLVDQMMNQPILYGDLLEDDLGNQWIKFKKDLMWSSVGFTEKFDKKTNEVQKFLDVEIEMISDSQLNVIKVFNQTWMTNIEKLLG